MNVHLHYIQNICIELFQEEVAFLFPININLSLIQAPKYVSPCFMVFLQKLNHEHYSTFQRWKVEKFKEQLATLHYWEVDPSPCLSLQLYTTGKLILAHVYHCNFTLLGIWFPAHVCHCNFSLLYSCFKAHVYHYITSHIWMLLSSHIQSFEMFTFLTIVLYVFVVGLSLRQLIIYANLSIYCHCWNRIINMHFQHLIFLQKIKLTSYSSEKALLFKLILNPFQYPNFIWKICPKM